MPLKIPKFTDSSGTNNEFYFCKDICFNGRCFFIARSTSCKIQFGSDVGTASLKSCTLNFYCGSDFQSVYLELLAKEKATVITLKRTE